MKMKTADTAELNAVKLPGGRSQPGAGGAGVVDSIPLSGMLGIYPEADFLSFGVRSEFFKLSI